MPSRKKELDRHRAGQCAGRALILPATRQREKEEDT